MVVGGHGVAPVALAIAAREASTISILPSATCACASTHARNASTATSRCCLYMRARTCQYSASSSGRIEDAFSCAIITFPMTCAICGAIALLMHLIRSTQSGTPSATRPNSGSAAQIAPVAVLTSRSVSNWGDANSSACRLAPFPEGSLSPRSGCHPGSILRRRHRAAWATIQTRSLW